MNSCFNHLSLCPQYTFWNFIPKNLFEQFRRIANFYFLIIFLVQVLDVACVYLLLDELTFQWQPDVWYFPSRPLSLSVADHRHPHQSYDQWFSSVLCHHSHSHQTGAKRLVVALLHLAYSARFYFFLLSVYPQGYEDWIRHKADDAINQCPVHVIQHGKVVRKQSQKLRVRNQRNTPVHIILFPTPHCYNKGSS